MTRWSASQFAAYRQRLIDEKIASAKEADAVEQSKGPWRSQWEKRYSECLELMRISGHINRWSFETLTIKLPGGTRYTPDFLVIGADGSIQFHEVKGVMRASAQIKLKQAIELHPEFSFFLVGGDMIARRMRKPGDVPAVTRGKGKGSMDVSADED